MSSYAVRWSPGAVAAKHAAGASRHPIAAAGRLADPRLRAHAIRADAPSVFAVGHAIAVAAQDPAASARVLQAHLHAYIHLHLPCGALAVPTAVVVAVLLINHLTHRALVLFCASAEPIIAVCIAPRITAEVAAGPTSLLLAVLPIRADPIHGAVALHTHALVVDALGRTTVAIAAKVLAGPSCVLYAGCDILIGARQEEEGHEGEVVAINTTQHGQGNVKTLSCAAGRKSK
mmetsp:Transcript_42029/g.91635  ORF Transcript_42029/g.91635 Transcript_42029/m.91635 type:complete len:232 (-) Transcript_42029:43-738(-)